MSLLPPAISDMGTSSGFTWYVQDRAGLGYEALKQAADALVLKANQRPELSGVYIDGLPEGTSLALQIDREKAEALGVSFDEINQTLSVTMGSNYVNDYTNNGRVQQVIIQADAPYRMQPEQILKLSEGASVNVCDALLERCTAATNALSGVFCYPHYRQCGHR